MLGLYLSLSDSEEEKSVIEELFNNYEKKLKAIAFSILHKNCDAEDAVSETFLRIIKHIDKITEISSDERYYYLVTILKNVSYNIYNKRNKINTVPIEECYILSDDKSPIDELMSNLDYKTLVKALDLLKDTDHEIIVLKLLHELSYEDIAESLNISVNAVRQRLYIAKKHFAEILKKERLI